jgi:hypothetical protein
MEWLNEQPAPLWQWIGLAWLHPLWAQVWRYGLPSAREALETKLERLELLQSTMAESSRLVI